MWKMDGRLSGIGRLHGNRLSGMLGQEQLLLMIFNSQWLSSQASTQVLIRLAMLYVLLNRLYGDKGALFLPEARLTF